MDELKPIHVDAIPAALEKAERYRLLNEPREAESICRDILHVDRENHDAIVMLLLALTDQFGKGMAVTLHHAEEILPRLRTEYERAYYSGVIAERWAKVQYEQGAEGHTVYDWFRHAMARYEAAEALSPPGHDDAILRWNTCARLLKRNPELRPRAQDQSIQAGFEDEVPYR